MNAEKIFISKNQVKNAGKILQNDPNNQEAIGVLSDFRKLHIYPLHEFYKFLKRKVHKWEKNIVSQRLKRMPAILAKIERWKEKDGWIDLAGMQDIGGCRAVVWSVKELYELQEKIINTKTRFNPPKKITDYVKSPKDSGYRSIHIIYKYQSANDGNKHLDGLLIEMQLRTLVQHYWSTAVETVGIFTNESLKSSQGNQEWLNFFKYVSQAFCIVEKTNLRDDLPKEKEVLQKIIIEYMKTLDVENVLNSYASTLKFQPSREKNIEYSLVVLDTQEKTILQKPFRKEEFDMANTFYEALEKKHKNDTHIQIVLISTSIAKNLKKAYPNYFADTIEFLKILTQFLKS